jgi:NTE family protein
MHVKTQEWLVDGPGSVFEGVPRDELQELLGRAKRHRFATGAVILAQGETPRVIYVTEAGAADVLVTDRYGREHLVGRIERGTTFGEMSLLTGDPAAATVRATEDLDALVLKQEDFKWLASRFPAIYRNLAESLCERLDHTNRLAAGRAPDRVFLLQDWGAPPLLGYALACSVAWHTRTRTLLAAVGEQFPEELERLAAATEDRAREPARRNPEPGVDVALSAPEGLFEPEMLATTAEELADRYEYVLLMVKGRVPGTWRRLDLSDGTVAPAGGGEAGEIAVRAWAGSDRRAPRPLGGVLDVPPLQASDESALAEGLLPTRTPAGRALGSLARDLTGLKLGLALGAGSLRGYAHFGVLRVLERLGVTPDYLAGTSIGASVAALYALGVPPTEGVAIFDKAAARAFRPTVPVYALLSGRGVMRFAKTMVGDVRIEDMDIPLAVVAADLLSRREVVLRRGVLWRALVASMAIPGVYPAQRMGPWVLVDGSVVDPVPISVCAETGASVVIGVSLDGPPTEPVDEAEAMADRGRPPRMLSVLMPSIEIMQSRVFDEPTQATSIVLRPELLTFGQGKLRDFAAGRVLVEEGERAAEEALPRMAAVLPWLRPTGATVPARSS